jgi:hypothetical protein
LNFKRCLNQLVQKSSYYQNHNESLGKPKSIDFEISIWGK